ncbi:hypothetical protein FisN_28Lh012 [Fistulifera solaris]|jgi:hypothetical protein|uniref:Chalcone isomerase domain-containing protein n=1 Tax=Fistulifera solaris TaxID=1519565 RepID=A0A1Z5KS89_FISSO|nr:hypothetical protein FisN_28Lh012 [Fistulifera solaris]|eukprot:GAX29183.1 hypothetical protein FisN_28Lh012 [Fistulifera solaris]
MISRNIITRAIAALLLVVVAVDARTDKATGISFPDTRGGLSLFGVGVRRKGPIKIYSVAMYSTSALQEKLAQCQKTDKKALSVLQKGVKEEGQASFSLNMNFKVGAEKMASAIADSVAPRHSGSSQDVEKLKALILKGVPQAGATKGTTMDFDCSHDSISVTVNGKAQGSVASSSLASAFCDVYLDDKCVSPAMRQDCLDHLCME